MDDRSIHIGFPSSAADHMDVSLESVDLLPTAAALAVGRTDGTDSGRSSDSDGTPPPVANGSEPPVSHEEFPPPPEFARMYTPESVASGAAPAPPPVPTNYIMYGEEVDLEAPPLRSLSEQGIVQHYSSNSDWKTEVKKVNQSIVFNFIDLVHILIHSPDSPERAEKLETIRTLFINLHHLINEFRFCQARDTLRSLISDQIDETKMAIRMLKRRIAATEALIGNYCSLMKNLVIEETGPMKGPGTVLVDYVSGFSDDETEEEGAGGEAGQRDGANGSGSETSQQSLRQ